MLLGPILRSIVDPTIEPIDNPFAIPGALLAEQAIETHHWMLAHAKAIETYRSLGPSGNIGITLSISPVYPKADSEADRIAARVEDGLHNRWFLDPLSKGEYPEDIRKLYTRHADIGIKEGDRELIKHHQVDFLGVNYYSPSRVKANSGSQRFGVEILPNPDEHPAFNGEVDPEGLYDLLVRIDAEYNHPIIYITENGSGFGREDDRLVGGSMHDVLRQDYIKRHHTEAHCAIQAGVKLNGYYVWSCFDNFEWVFG